MCAKCLLVPTTCYFDDYVSPPALVKSTDWTVNLFLDLLGWKFDRDGDKADVFSFVTAALGVLFSLEASRGGLARVCNTAKRCDELVGQIDAILAAGKLHRKDGLVLRGRLAFADAQVLGRAGAKPFSPDVSEDLPHAIRLLARLQGNVPRVLGPASFESWSLYTDASYEPDGTGGIGGVLARPDGSIFA